MFEVSTNRDKPKACRDALFTLCEARANVWTVHVLCNPLDKTLRKAKIPTRKFALTTCKTSLKRRSVGQRKACTFWEKDSTDDGQISHIDIGFFSDPH